MPTHNNLIYWVSYDATWGKMKILGWQMINIDNFYSLMQYSSFQIMCAIEAQLENLMGTFHCQMKGIYAEYNHIKYGL
jgi:hypothetical protein